MEIATRRIANMMWASNNHNVAHDDETIKCSFVHEIFCFVDFCSQVWGAAAIRVVEQHYPFVGFLDFLCGRIRGNAQY
jgi:hypothetical protein